MANEAEPKFTPGPWRACKDGACGCKNVMAADHPVAVVTAGVWGDTWPSLRMVDGATSLNPQVEPFIEMCAYGEVPEEQAAANARLIAAAPDLYAALQRCLDNMGYTHMSVADLEEEERLGNGSAPILLAARAALSKARGSQ